MRSLPQKKGMTEEELGRLVIQQARRAMNADGSQLSDIRQEMLALYRGEALEGDDSEEMQGRSKYKTREVLEGVEWVLVSILRFFFSTPSPVEFEAMGPEDEELAEQETAVCNHTVLDENFLALSSVFREALLAPVAYARVRVVEYDHREVEELEDLTDLDLEPIYAQENVERVEILKTETRTIDPLETLPSAQHDRRALEAAGQPVMPIMQQNVYHVKVHKRVQRTRVVNEAVPPEEMLIDPSLTSLDLDAADFVAQKSRVSVSDLVEEGYDYDELIELAGFFEYDEHGEDVMRRPLTDEDPDQFRNGDNTTQPYVEVHEAFIRADYDGDGIAELRRVFMVGDKVFENEQVPDHPFAAFSCIPQPHRHVGISYAELLKDIQLLATVLVRQLLDSIYAVNRERAIINIHAFAETGGMESLQNRNSSIIEVTGDPRAAVFHEQTSSLANEILPVLDAVERKQSMRTGVSPATTLDPEVLKRTTASAHAGSQDNQSGRIELIVRTLAETGYRQLVLKTHSALRRHGGGEVARRIRGKRIQFNPLKWGTRYDLSINVGIGYASRQQNLDALMQILALMEKAVEFGLVDERGAYNAFKRIVDATGVGFPTDFFLDPKDPNWKAPQKAPDPNLLLAQASMMEAQGKTQAEQAKLQHEQKKLELQIQQEQIKAQAAAEKARQDEAKRQQQAQHEMAKMRMQYELEMRKLHVQVAEARTRLLAEATKAGVADATIQKLRAEAEAALAAPRESSDGQADGE